MPKPLASSPKLAPYSDAKQIRSFLLGQICGTISPITPSDLSSRTIIITGSNTGLGLESAKQLYGLGVGRLILACRNLEKAEAAKREILSQANPGSHSTKQTIKQTIEMYELEMANTSSIARFAELIARDLDRVDAIILNAGVDLVSYRKAEPQGYEMTLMVNVVGTFLLAILIVPILRKSATEHQMSAPPRISIVGSAVHFFAKYELLLQASVSGEGILSYLSDENRWHGKIGEDRYYLSKGMVQMLVRQLARRINDSAEKSGKPTVIVNAASPGYCRTNLFNESASVASRMGLKLIGRDADVGARAMVIGAIGQDGGDKSHGGYMSEGKVRDYSSWLETEQGDEIARKLWDEVAEVVETVQPGTIALI